MIDIWINIYKCFIDQYKNKDFRVLTIMKGFVQLDMNEENLKKMNEIYGNSIVNRDDEVLEYNWIVDGVKFVYVKVGKE